ncbi:immunoglobulin-like domain-containing protein [Paenibacillus sp. JCM 10914]|uniref:immunoglobulin-like domain-containing protein n=1 Tax=Paenibacillus sp. JCM 10914 TaxID=1236974 RepID=UPI0003CC64EE|nr:immunoglobulin-like domain-containing protein [Paenibacillus sp. JCM 10914]GAE07873.1 hypothetical protein JCM10914_4120 [Paenibacillus sp. JCM 10914]
MKRRRLIASLLVIAMLSTLFTPSMTVSAAGGDDVSLLTVNAGTDSNTATNADTPDGQKAWRLNNGTSKDGAPWDNLFTPSVTPIKDISAYRDGYFVFEMFVPNEGFKNMQGNNWLVIVSDSNPAEDKFNNDSRLQLDLSAVTTAAVGTWATVYTKLSSSSAVAGNFNDAWLDQVTRLAMHLQWDTSVPSTDVYIQNPRFQKSTLGVPGSPLTAPVLDVATQTVTANAPASGQAVEFAISEDGIAPATGWVDGIHNDHVYTYQFDTLPTADTYYVFARAKADGNYNFVGASTRTTVTFTDDQTMVNEAASSLTWNTIRNSNTIQSEVRTALTLPATGANDTAIVWSAEPAGIIDTVTGSVTRDLDEDKAVTLTATITKGSATPAVKTFELTVASTNNELAEVFIDFNDPGTFTAVNAIGSGFGDGGDPAGPYPGLQGNGIGVSLIGDGGTAVEQVTQSSVGAVKVGNLMYVIVDDLRLKQASKVELEVKYWRPSATGGISLQYNTIYPGNFSGFDAYRSASLPATGSGDAWVTSKVVLNGANFAIGAQNQGAHFRIDAAGAIIQSIRVTEIPPTDEEAVQLVSNALTWDAIKGTNTRQDLVETNLTLAKTGSAGTNIVWTSTNNALIDSDTGAVNRQEANTPVTLTATVSKGTATPVVKTFHIVVRGTGIGTDEDAVNDMLNKLTWDSIKGVNASEADGGMNNVTTNLVLPSIGDNMTDITWTTSAPALITTAGVIPTNRPDGGGDVTLTATVKRGLESAPVIKTKTFALKVPDRYDYDKHLRTAIAQEHDAKDWAISDFNVLAFGAKTVAMAEAEGLAEFDNREAFQAAIDAAYNDGGGVVYIPAGTYAFYSETTGTVSVRSTTGSTTYEYQQVLKLRAGVQLRGEWDNPDANNYDGKIDGTILAVYAGHNSANYDTYVDSDERENQTGGKKVANVSDRFIDMEQGTGVSNLSVWYPNQDIHAETVVEKRGKMVRRQGNLRRLTEFRIRGRSSREPETARRLIMLRL